MTTTYFLAAFSSVTGRSTIHAGSCDVPRKRKGVFSSEIDAATPQEAARIYAQDEDLAARGLPLPTICACAKL